MEINWIKKGLIFNPIDKFNWAQHSATQPTPIILNDKIRVFVGLRDVLGVSRIGWVDLSLENPELVISYSLKPCLDIGLPGTFDDNGVAPTAILQIENKLFLYYAGYQVHKHVRFTVFTGLAVSDNWGESFERIQLNPIMDRTNNEFLFRVIHSIFWDENIWKVYYGAGNSFENGADKTYPIYDIRYLESDSVKKFPDNGTTILHTIGNEYRLGRPYVVKLKNEYLMFFGSSTPNQPYRLAAAFSKDGVYWQRDNKLINLEYNIDDFDSEMSAFPSFIQIDNKFLLFYNGNNYGENGFGLAIGEIYFN